MINKLRDLMFLSDRPLRERRFIMSGIVACVAMFAVILSSVTTNQSMLLTLGLIASIVIILVTMTLAIKTDNIPTGQCVIIILSNLIVLPIGYLLGGGIHSGSSIWFMVGIIFVFVLFDGARFWIFFILSLLAYAAAVAFGALYPQYVVELQAENSVHLDVFVAVACASLLIGFLFKMQSDVLEKELERAEGQTDEIEKLNELQGNFFSSMSHEIRTPISTIIGLNEMNMREKQLPVDIKENTLNIQNASKMLLSLINDLLDMSKIQSGKMQIVEGEYDTSRMLSEITNLHWNRAMEKDLRFDIQVGKDIPPVLFGDETRIKQIIINLLTNAIKYTEEGSVTLRYGGDRMNDGRFLLRVEVEDTGIGVRKEDIQYLFDSFRRVEGDDTKNIEGTGLGLAITKQLVELMDGTITVNSIYTKGSTFRVEIPQGIVNTESASFRAPGLLARDTEEYHHSFEAPDASVLIVDDNEMNRIVCRKLLRSTMVKVDLAESGKECLEKTRNKHYDAIFMDHEMPGMDGIETLAKIQQQIDGMCKDTPVVALTANAGSDKDVFYKEKGFAAYLSKPIQSSRLEAILLACLPDDIVEKTFSDKEEESIHIADTIHKRPYLVTTDSICDLPLDLLKENEIKVMPYYIITGNGRFRDITEIDADNLQDIVENNMSIKSEPSTVEDYEHFFGEALTESRVVIHLSTCKSASSAYENAKRASDSFGNVIVIDSGQISAGLGLVALRTAELFRSGLRMEEVLEEIEKYKKKIRGNYLVPKVTKVNTKQHINAIAKSFVNVFNLEPVFTMRRERIVLKRFLMGYIRSTPEQFVALCLKNKNDIDTKRLFVTFTGCPADTRNLVMSEIEKYAKFDEVIVNKSSAATLINCGPDSFGLTYERIIN